MNRALFAAGLAAMALAVSACASDQPEPKIVTQYVDRPVAVSCVPKDTPAAPVYTDTVDALLAAPDFAARYALIAENFPTRLARMELMEKIAADCAKAAPPK